MSLHIPVLLDEVLDVLNVHSQKNYIDCTFGGAGYTRAILERNGPDGKVLAIDADAKTMEHGKELLKNYGERFTGIEGNFRSAAVIAREHGFCPAAGVVWDIGLSTDLIKASGRGFSFYVDEPLDMRFSLTTPATAADILHKAHEQDLADIIYEYGEERYARRIARSIVRARERQPIIRTAVLVDIIRSAVPPAYRNGRIHCATRTFQALRIAVNDELEALEESLTSMKQCIDRNGVMAVVTFHSLEDRIVKQLFKQWQRDKSALPITKKPIKPSFQEIKTNSASRSAKLRAIRIA